MTEAFNPIDFTDISHARVIPHRLESGEDHPLSGQTGEVAMIYYAMTGWPSDLLYLTMIDGERAGKTYRIFAHHCEPAESEAQS